MGTLSRVRSYFPTRIPVVRRLVFSPEAVSLPKSTRGFSLPAILEHNEFVNSLIQEKTKMDMIEPRCSTQETYLASVTERLRLAKLALDNYTKIMIECATPQQNDTEVFTSADQSFIERVTGTNLDWRKWHVQDEIGAGPYTEIFPSDGFQKLFQQNSMVFCMYKEAGRRTVLDLFFRDVLSREEFGSALRVFPEYKFCVTSTEDSRPVRLSGKADYTIGHSASKDMFEREPSMESHLVAAEAKRDWPEESYWQCIVQTAALHKSRKDANKKNRRVWGILSNAIFWKFLFIDEAGQLWTSADFHLGLRGYDEDEVLAVYRVIYHIVKSCNEACPPSAPEKK
jgi:hypothetical protein